MPDDAEAARGALVHASSDGIVEKGSKERGDGEDEGANDCDSERLASGAPEESKKERTIRAELGQVRDEQRGAGVGLESVGEDEMGELVREEDGESLSLLARGEDGGLEVGKRRRLRVATEETEHAGGAR